MARKNPVSASQDQLLEEFQALVSDTERDLAAVEQLHDDRGGAARVDVDAHAPGRDPRAVAVDGLLDRLAGSDAAHHHAQDLVFVGQIGRAHV